MNPSQKLHVIYIPGIGDAAGAFQPWAVETWPRWGAEAELFSMNWGDDVVWAEKFEHLLDRIDALAADGKNVALVGASAGAAAVVNAYAARQHKIVGVVCICGKINNPDSIGNRYRRNYPSFVVAAYKTAEALAKLDDKARRRILCRYALFDNVVTNRADSRIPGARNRFSPTILHSLTIAFQITFGAPSFLRFLKKQANSL
jgi:pimeloyl-ACP methyl ester carboxylesterase